MSSSTHNVAFTAPINPAGVTPVLTRAQLWAGMLINIRFAERFIGQAIQSTNILSETTDEEGNAVTTREIVFRADGRKAKEVVTAFEDCRLLFVMGDGSTINNIISETAEGELFLTFCFEWRHKGLVGEELKAKKLQEQKMGQAAVQQTIAAMRELVVKGEL